MGRHAWINKLDRRQVTATERDLLKICAKYERPDGTVYLPTTILAGLLRTSLQYTNTCKKNLIAKGLLNWRKS